MLAKINVYKDYSTLSFYTAKEIIGLVKMKPDAVLCLAAGDTPKLAYTLMAQMALDEKVDCSACTFIGLDEWVTSRPGFLHQHIFVVILHGWWK